MPLDQGGWWPPYHHPDPSWPWLPGRHHQATWASCRLEWACRAIHAACGFGPVLRM